MARITPQTAAVNIVTWMLLIISALAILVRLVVNRINVKGFNTDDGFAIASLATHIGSGIATTLASNSGIGRDANTLSDLQRIRFGKNVFASNILFIATIAFAKISILTLFNLVTQTPSHRRVGLVISILIGVWASTSCVALGFLCGVPRPWNISPACRREAPFWYAFESLNILSDVVIIFFTVYIIIPLNMERRKKVIVLSCFVVRVFDIGATAAQLIFTKYFTSANITKDIFPWLLVAQFVQCITIITSCIPYLRSLLESIPSGMLMSDEIRRKNPSSKDGSGSWTRDPDFGFVYVGSASGQKSAPSQGVGSDAGRPYQARASSERSESSSIAPLRAPVRGT